MVGERLGEVGAADVVAEGQVLLREGGGDAVGELHVVHARPRHHRGERVDDGGIAVLRGEPELRLDAAAEVVVDEGHALDVRGAERGRRRQHRRLEDGHEDGRHGEVVPDPVVGPHHEVRLLLAEEERVAEIVRVQVVRGVELVGHAPLDDLVADGEVEPLEQEVAPLDEELLWLEREGLDRGVVLEAAEGLDRPVADGVEVEVDRRLARELAVLGLRLEAEQVLVPLDARRRFHLVVEVADALVLEAEAQIALDLAADVELQFVGVRGRRAKDERRAERQRTEASTAAHGGSRARLRARLGRRAEPPS